MKPLILVTLDLGEVERRGVPFPTAYAKLAYARAVEAAGGLPLFVAPTREPGLAQQLCVRLDGLIVTGGAFDIEPERYGKKSDGQARVDAPKPLRTELEGALIEGALARDRPVLGICGGMQLLNVVLGGTLILDIQTANPAALDHEQPTSPALPAHRVQLLPGTRLAAAVGRPEIEVNTTHHQAVDQLGKGLVVAGTSPDGVIEAIEHRDRAGVLGVQWHPELLGDSASAAIYSLFVRAAR